MKKIINNPDNVVSEFIDGLIASRPDLKRLEGLNCIVKKEPTPHKVALVSLGGSGHEPAHAGYIGLNGLDGVACGQVFASPSIDQIVSTAKAVSAGSGVLFIVKNYKGDNLNTDMAMGILKEQGIICKKLIVSDDIAPVPGLDKKDRRGVAGTILIHSLLGTAARNYNPLDFLFDLGTEAVKNLKTMGLALTPCTIPSVGNPNFSIPENKLTLGIGIHGEPGVRDEELGTCDHHIDTLVDHILEDFRIEGNELKEKDRVVILVNGMGGTPIMELYIANRRVFQRMEELKVTIMKNLVGNYMTSLEMAGCSVTLLKLTNLTLTYINNLC